MPVQSRIEDSDRVRIRSTELQPPEEPPGRVGGSYRPGPHHPPSPTPSQPSLRRDGYTVHVRVWRDVWDQAGTLGLPRSDIMREALEAAVGADVDLDEARKQETAAEAVLRGRRAARQALEAREAREAREQDAKTRRDTAINELRGQFDRYREGPRKNHYHMTSWVRSRQAQVPELRRMETAELLEHLLEVPP